MSGLDLPPSYQLTANSNGNNNDNNRNNDFFTVLQLPAHVPPSASANTNAQQASINNTTNTNAFDLLSMNYYPNNTQPPVIPAAVPPTFTPSPLPLSVANIQQIPVLPPASSQDLSLSAYSQISTLNNNVSKMQENFDKVMRSISDVNQRLSTLEKLTRDILENQKTFESDFKRSSQSISIPVGTSPVYPTMAKQSVTPTISTLPTLNKLQPVSVLNLAKTDTIYNVDQIEADRLLAARLQNEINSTRDIQLPVPATKAEPGSECPVCGVLYPMAQMEGHVNSHFGDVTDSVTLGGPNSGIKDDQPSFWGKLFGKKDAATVVKKDDKLPIPTTTTLQQHH